LWDLESGEQSGSLDWHLSDVFQVDVSPDGRRALSALMLDSSVRLWDLETGREIHFDVAISPDGHTALSGATDQMIIQWQLAIPSLDELFDWVEANRHVRELTCDERELYQIEPLCDVGHQTNANHPREGKGE
jgi:WD40 repeat protein